MFNFFKRPDESKNCYLNASKVIAKEILNEDKLSQWDEMLEDKQLPEFFKAAIIRCLLPNKISPLKFLLNSEYFNDPYPGFMPNENLHIAPSLKVIKSHPIDMTAGYPDWFYKAFPDVALWAMKGRGLELVEKKLQNYSEDEMFDGHHFNISILNEIIRMFSSNTSKSLECKNY